MRTACPQPNINKARPNLVLSPSLSLFLQLFDGVDPVAPPRSGGGRRDDGRRRRGGRRQVCQAGAVFSKFARDERKLQSPASSWLYPRSRSCKFGKDPKDGTIPGCSPPSYLLLKKHEPRKKGCPVRLLIAPKINIYKRRATAQQWWYVTSEGVVGEIQSFQLRKRSKSGGYTAFKLVVV
uniref:Uncharacterized protein n=1 Tax=Oryza meridionalis TaxID=40149 RepID=A0A0E0CHS2_9ORYZ